MNLTYINTEKNESWKRELVWWFFEITYYAIVFVLISSFFLEDLPIFKLDSIFNKIAFLVNTWVLLSWGKTIFQNLVRNNDGKKFLITYIIGIVIALIQYVWIFKLKGFFPVLGVSILVFIILIARFVKIEKQALDSEEQKQDSKD